MGLWMIGGWVVMRLRLAPPCPLAVSLLTQSLYHSGSHDPFDKHQSPKIFTLRFITVAKLQLRSINENNFMVGGSPQHEELY